MHSQILKKIFIYNLLFLLFNCQLKIPLNYFPIHKYNNSSPSLTMRNIIQQKVYANLEIGTPKKTIQIPLNLDSNDFFIVDSGDADFKPDYFSDIKFYDSSSSTSWIDLEEGDYKHADDFDMASYYKEIFYFNNQQYEMEFYLPISYSNPYSGGIGMKLNPTSDLDTATPDRERTFFEKLKTKKLIKSYFWSIFYNSKEYKKEDEAFLLLGCLPEEITNNTDLGYYKKGYFNEKYKKTVNLKIQSQEQVLNIFEIDYITAYEGKNQSKIIEDFPSGNTDYKEIEIDYNLGGVKASKHFKDYYGRVFEPYFSKGICFNSSIEKISDSTFYYCKNDKNIISEIKKVFPGIIFKSHDLVYNFILEADDLFIEQNGYVYCLIYFTNFYYEKRWVMGRPFLKKYLFTVNYNDKYLSFYNNDGDEGNNNPDNNNQPNNQDNSEKGISTGIFILVIIGTIILVAIISFVLFKFVLYEKFFRKKRANELNDNDYEYTSANNENEGLNINV